MCKSYNLFTDAGKNKLIPDGRNINSEIFAFGTSTSLFLPIIHDY